MGLRVQIVAVIILFISTFAAAQQKLADPLSFSFDEKRGQVEVGGKFAGAEFHHSRPLPSRISLYYPVANSIDLSYDYWKRDESLPMLAGVQVGNESRRWVGKEGWSYVLSPHSVAFRRNGGNLGFEMKYEFCLNQPAMVFTWEIKNNSSTTVPVTAYTHLRLSLRTSHSYARKDSAWTAHDATRNAVVANFDDKETRLATVFVLNAGSRPTQWTTDNQSLGATDTGSSRWISPDMKLQDKQSSSPKKVIPVAAFVYEKTLRPNESLKIVQVIGSARRKEAPAKMATLLRSWRNEVASYDAFVRRSALENVSFSTGDAWLDRSAAWARGLLATNAHYLDGNILPMPCPAEYNFYFTHDALVTDLAAVHFDIPRVKKDLLYIASLAKDKIIPHAYYWKDDGYKTEYCTPDNWNHLWFILVSARYLRHSADAATCNRLYPLVTQSLKEMLSRTKSDHLAYAFRPDWWDIGHIDGPRSYITVLTIQALHEYIYFSSILKKNLASLPAYELLADSMRQALQTKLWDADKNYLMNWNEGKEDEHFYMGSLLAPAFGIMDDKKSKTLVSTATKELLAPQVGIRCVTPVDFHTKEAIAYYKFAGDEAGQPYYYINGGVWPHNNAWYALALINSGASSDALRFVKTTMTIDGVAASPMGVPAMYEYRYSDPSSPEYGKVDKPSFLWAGGFYLLAVYQLFGVRENDWNISFAGPVAGPAAYSLTLGRQKLVHVSGEGQYLQSCTLDGKAFPSLVLTDEARSARRVDVRFGTSSAPYLEKINARVASAKLRAGRLSLDLSSFDGHRVRASVVSPNIPQRVLLNGKTFSNMNTEMAENGLHRIVLNFTGTESVQHLTMEF